MALTTCPDCNSEVSANAPSCPKCGSPLKAPPAETKKRGPVKTCCLLFAGLMGLAVVASVVQRASMTPEERQAQDAKMAQQRADREAASAKAKAESEAAKVPAKVGEVVRDAYFEVTVNRVSSADRIGNEFAGQDAGPGNTFLVMNVTIRNVDSEARFFQDGRLWVTHGGKELEFDASETVLADGWIVFENLNPLTTVTGNVAFKVPSPTPRPIYWQPGRGEKRILVLP